MENGSPSKKIRFNAEPISCAFAHYLTTGPFLGFGIFQQPVEEPHGRDGTEEDKPEVEENVDLLIDDVYRKYTEGVVVLD